jgi:hypothetical protein
MRGSLSWAFSTHQRASSSSKALWKTESGRKTLRFASFGKRAESRPLRTCLTLGKAPIGKPAAVWHFFAVEVGGLPLHWEHQTEDDDGHAFAFFWHPLTEDLDQDWHPMFHEALRVIRRSLPLS